MTTRALTVARPQTLEAQPKQVAGSRTVRHRRKVRANIAGLMMMFLILAVIAVTATIVAASLGSASVPSQAGDFPNAPVTGSPNNGGNVNGLIPVSDTKTDQSEPTETTEKPEPLYTQQEVEMLAKAVYGEALVTRSDTQMSAVVWCILNRVDSTGYACGGSIEYVVTFRNQFVGYREDNPVTPHIEWLVRDVLDRWYAEKAGEEDVGRTLPKDYMWFSGDGKTNTFRNDYESEFADIWDWSLPSPYEN